MKVFIFHRGSLNEQVFLGKSVCDFFFMFWMCWTNTRTGILALFKFLQAQCPNSDCLIVEHIFVIFFYEI